MSVLTPNRPPSRRRVLQLATGCAVFGYGLAATAERAAAAGAAANQWFAVRGDDGHPVPNTRAPAELVEEIDDLRGAIWAGPAGAAVKLVEFYDYNCPWCRAADAARGELRRSRPDLRVGLVGNPILSPASREAAAVDLAVLLRHGAAASYRLHERLFAFPGRIDRARALETVAALGHDPGEIGRAASGPEVGDGLARQMALAASLGITATPSYVVGGAVVLGYPGPRSLSAIVDSTARCGTVAC